MRSRLVLGALCAVAGLSGILAPVLAAAAGPPPAAAAAEATVVLAELDGVVDPLAARYVERVIARAGRSTTTPAVVLRIDTPGGLDSSMRAIIKSIKGSRVPVLCWVGPAGARAASAGAIVMLGCPLGAMAPSTNLGAAHPVGLQGEVLDQKVTNDAAAYARSLAEDRGRDPDIAEAMVRRSISLTAEEALQRGIVDVRASSVRELLTVAEGRRVRTASGETRLALTGATVEEARMTFMESLLHRLVDPNVAFLLLNIGVLALIFEVTNPGFGAPGVVGAFAVLAAFVMLGMLPVNLAGLVLILVAFGFFVVEAFTPGVGAAAFAGVVALILGGLFLFDASVPGAQVSRGLVVGTAISMALVFAVALRAVIETRRRVPDAATMRDLVGEEGVVERALGPTGVVRARLESWSARSTAGYLPEGAPVRVTAVNGLTLEVEPLPAELPAGEDPGGTEG